MMLSKLVRIFPRSWLVFMYKHMPFTKFKNRMVYRAQQKFLVSVLGVLTNDQGQVLLLKHVYRKEPWGIPGGWMELEDPELALSRELKEETGISVQSFKLEKAVQGINPDRVDLIFSGKVNEERFTPSILGVIERLTQISFSISIYPISRLWQMKSILTIWATMFI